MTQLDLAKSSPSPRFVRINRSRRRTRESLIISDEEFESRLQTAHHYHPTENTFLKKTGSSTFKSTSTSKEHVSAVDFSVSSSGLEDEHDLPVSSSGLEGEDEDFPVHQGQTVHEFPTHAGIQAHYRMHEDDLTQYDLPHPNLSESPRLS